MLYTVFFQPPIYNKNNVPGQQSLNIEAPNSNSAIEILKMLIPNVSATIARPANERLFIEWHVTDIKMCATDLLSDDYTSAYNDLSEQEKHNLCVMVLSGVIESHDCNNGVTWIDFEYALQKELDLLRSNGKPPFYLTTDDLPF